MTLLSRALLVALLAALAAPLSDPGHRLAAACAGVALGAVLVGLEWALVRAASRGVVGASAGLVAGLACALMVAATVLAQLPEGMRAATALTLVIGFGWLGVSLGFHHGSSASALASTGGKAAEQPAGRLVEKVVDTSVIIDGRVVDVIESGFLEGVLVVPQFILRELQQVADSSDPLKRNRGRKGLDTLKAMQSSKRVRIELTDEDTADTREVDGKLLWLAERRHAALLTNDYNLNKVAQLRGVRVLNVNDLANAVKPVVLPGESLAIQVIKEGKERNQGVGYLDDGTMVVVENGRRLLGQKVDVVVSSVIQTNAGKMIFATSPDESDMLRTPPRGRRGSDGEYLASGGSAPPAQSIGQG